VRAGDSNSRGSTGPMARTWLATVLLLVLICAARTSTIALDDDNLYLAYLAAGPTAEAKALEGRIADRAAAERACELEAFRISVRDRYAANYAGYSALGGAINRTIAAFEARPRSVETVIAALIVTKALVSLCIGLALVWTAARLKDQGERIAVAAAIVALAGLDWLAHTGALRLYGISDVGYPLKAAVHLGYSFVVADEPHSLFGLTPRNAALGLFAIALMLKWNDRPVAASIVILAIAALHQTYAGIALLLFCAASAISRPDILKPVQVRLILVLCLLLSLLRDRYGTEGTGLLAVAAGVLTAGAFAAFAFVQSPAYQRLRDRMTGRFRGDEILIDAGVLVAICICGTLLAMIFGPSSEGPVRLYFWSDLAIRIWSFARFPFFVAVALILARWFARPSRAIAATTVTAAILSIAVALQIDMRPEWSIHGSLDSNLAAVRDGALDFEGALYLHLASVSVGAESADRAAEMLSSLPMGCRPN